MDQRSTRSGRSDEFFSARGADPGGTQITDFYAPVARYLIAPLWAYKERSPYLRHLKYLEKSQYFTLDQHREIQWKKLKRLFDHAYKTTPFYRKRFDVLGAVPNDIKTWVDFQELKPLTKDDIRENREDLISKSIPRDKLVPKKTSGSTGISLEFYVDEDSLQWKRACIIRHNRWAGWNIGDTVAAIWGNPEHYKTWRMRLRNILLDRYTYLDTLKMDKRDMELFYHAINRKRPALLFGHAHSLYIFSRFLKEKGWIPPKPKGIISSAMVLHTFERKTIEEAFGCKVTNRYGCEEVSLIASECEHHQHLHMNFDTLVIEVIKDLKPVLPGEPGSIVVTDLTNYGMPFIRYKVGDVGILAEGNCSCGRSFPMLKSIEGRVADYIVTPEGKYISGISLTENFAMLLPEIKQLQIYQDQIDHLILRIVKSNNYSRETETNIQALFNKLFGLSMSYELQYLNVIPQEPSGKYRFCISKISNQLI